NCGCEGQALCAVEVSFDSVGAGARCRVEMDANKNRVAVRIRDRDASSQRQEDVAVSRHHDMIAVGLKDGFESLRYVEIHHAFWNALVRNSAPIESAVTRIDHDRS